MKVPSKKIMEIVFTSLFAMIVSLFFIWILLMLFNAVAKQFGIFMSW